MANYWGIVPLMVIGWLAIGLIAMRLQPRMGDVILMVGHDSPVRLRVYFWLAIVFWPTFGLIFIPVGAIDQWLLDRKWSFRSNKKRTAEVYVPGDFKQSANVYTSRAELPAVGEVGKIYVVDNGILSTKSWYSSELLQAALEATQDNGVYSWDGVTYVRISEPSHVTIPTYRGIDVGNIGYEAAHIGNNDIGALYPNASPPLTPSATDSALVANAIENPPPPNAALRQARQRHKERHHDHSRDRPNH